MQNVRYSSGLQPPLAAVLSTHLFKTDKFPTNHNLLGYLHDGVNKTMKTRKGRERGKLKESMIHANAGNLIRTESIDQGHDESPGGAWPFKISDAKV